MGKFLLALAVLAIVSLGLDELTKNDNVPDAAISDGKAIDPEVADRRREFRRAVFAQALGWSEWQYWGQACADGWRSTSIGRPGACSWHGGVVRVWTNDAGGTIECRTGLPPDVEEAVRQMREFKRLFCTY